MASKVFCIALPLLAAGVAGNAQQSAPADIRSLTASASADSNDPLAHYRLAIAQLSKKNYAEAEAALHQAITLDPQFAPGYFYLAAIPRKRTVRSALVHWRGAPVLVTVFGNDSLARESYRLRRIAFFLNPMLDLGRPHRSETPLKWANGTAQALAEFRRGYYQQAYDRLTDLIGRSEGKSDSVAAAFLWYRALCAAQLSQWDGAIADATRLLERAKHRDSLDLRFERAANDPDGYRFFIAFLHQQAGRLDEAIRLYQELLETNIGLYTAHIRLAEIHEQRRDWDAAVLERERAVATNPEDPSLLFDHGVTLIRAGRLADAVDVLRRAILANPRETRAYYTLGLVYSDLHRKAEARPLFEQFIVLAPNRYQSLIDDAKRRLAEP
ncbi:MAG: tetratricopeptide repeat protein [Gemmatimonadales bacterium]